ncbi:hypothetical protein [Rhodothermus marinus]|uniref:hypothetical protein n=1 Tax=Rhodothermus marinus TaxID=29549 RepID=UPI000A863115|nr:hypothetical protein [Rhodothermus marinus]
MLVLDDLKQDARREYLRVLSFLEVPDDGRNDFSVRNPAKRARSYFIQGLITVGMKTERIVKSKLGRPPVCSEFWWNLNNWNKVPIRRPPLPLEVRQELVSYFKDDIHKLEQILDRDLSHWYKLN